MQGVRPTDSVGRTDKIISNKYINLSKRLNEINGMKRVKVHEKGAASYFIGLVSIPNI
jgi:hypothetical protein